MRRSMLSYMRPMESKYGMYVPLPTGPGKERRYCSVGSLRPDFSESDLLMLRLVRPHLHEVYLDAERRRYGIPH